MQQQQPNTGLVFVDDFSPGVTFRVVSRVQQTTVDQILGTQVNGQVVRDPSDYNGYIITYDQQCFPGSYNLVFVRGSSLSQDQSYTFQTDATIFSNTIQLLQASIQTGGAAAAGDQAGNVTGDNVTGDNVTEDNVTEDNVTDGNVTGDNVTGDNETGGNQTEDVNVTINATNRTGGG